jgi:hypothetical protein
MQQTDQPVDPNLKLVKKCVNTRMLRQKSFDTSLRDGKAGHEVQIVVAHGQGPMIFENILAEKLGEKVAVFGQTNASFFVKI